MNRDSNLLVAQSRDDLPEPHEAAPAAQLTWLQSEGASRPHGVAWIERDQAFNFAIHSEYAETVTLLLYSSADLVNPVFTFPFDYLRNKFGPVWHCRIPASEIREARYYAYSVTGPAGLNLHAFDPQKILLDPYAKCVFFPPAFDRTLAKREGSNAGARLWECSRRIGLPMIGKATGYSTTNRTPSSMSCT